LAENDGFDPKRPETHFLPWLTWFDLYWLGGLGFDPKRLETHFLPWSTWFDPY
jgi:P2-related tail formation protein